MNLYEIDGRSDCRTYFDAYLQRVLVYANSKEEALELAKEIHGEEFVTKHLGVELIYEGVPIEPACIYSVYDTDY